MAFKDVGTIIMSFDFRDDIKSLALASFMVISVRLVDIGGETSSLNSGVW